MHDTLPRFAVEEQITCLVADDHPAVLSSVSDLLSASSITVVAQARSGREALAAVEATRPDVALVDIRMPEPDGLELVRRLKRTSPETAVLVYTGFGDRGHLTDAIDAGARGFVLKDAPLVDVVRAVRTVAGGRMFIDPSLSEFLTPEGAGAAPVLSARERDVLRLLADGCSNGEIGTRLFISPETVRKHVARAIAKLDASTRTEAVATALRHSLIS